MAVYLATGPRPRLRELQLLADPLDPTSAFEAFEALRGGAAPNLTSLDAREALLDGALRVLAECLRDDRVAFGGRLRELVLSGAGLGKGEEDVAAILHAVAKGRVCRELHTLSISRCGGGKPAISTALAKAIEAGASSQLTALSLWGNGIDETGALALAKALEHTPGRRIALTCLNLASNHLTPNATLALASALNHGLSAYTLVEVDLSFNIQIGDEGVCAFMDVLGSATAAVQPPFGWRKLSRLGLGGVGLSTHGAYALAQTLRRGACPALSLLSLIQNHAVSGPAREEVSRAKRGLRVEW